MLRWITGNPVIIVRKRREWGLRCICCPVSEKPIDSSRTVNHDRSGLWATDPLDEFSNERPASISPATPLPTPSKRPSLRPVVTTPSAPPVSKNRRGLWSFASGSAFGALVCVILVSVSWLTSSEQPRAEPFTPRPEPVAIPPPAPPPCPRTPALHSGGCGSRRGYGGRRSGRTQSSWGSAPGIPGTLRHPR